VKNKIIGLLSLFSVTAGGCANEPIHLPNGAAAYNQFPAPALGRQEREYLIGPLDVISVTVFQEPDLTVSNVPVDSNGKVILPLIGEVTAGGEGANAFARDIAARLSERYLVNPQVSVVVTSSSSQRVTVEGAVIDPGVFEIRGRTTLLDAMALAKGPTRVAQTDKVVVFRDINGVHMGAVFDLIAIRTGNMADPEIRGDDTVVVGISHGKTAYRDILSTLPIIGTFTAIAVR
jgi:polysaccharide export outer membrane protein